MIHYITAGWLIFLAVGLGVEAGLSESDPSIRGVGVVLALITGVIALFNAAA